MFTRFRTFILLPNILRNELSSGINAVLPIKCTDLLRRDKRYKSHGSRKTWPNNWLPFKWERPEQGPGYFETGDPPSLEGMPKFDAGRLQPIFENLEGLKNAPEDVKKLFTLGMLPRREVLSLVTKDEQKPFLRHPFDAYSPEIKVAIYTFRIRATLEVLRNDSHSAVMKRNIICMNGKRKKWLNVLYRTDKKKYEFVVSSLNINNTPSPIGVAECQRAQRKRELRRLTREYCEKLRKEKLNKYHEHLRAEQIRFAKEKEEIEQWITETLKKFKLKDPRCGEIV